jgi:hypothetical protein
VGAQDPDSVYRELPDAPEPTAQDSGAPLRSSAEHTPEREAEEPTHSDAGSVKSFDGPDNPFADSHRAPEEPTHSDAGFIKSFDAGSINSVDRRRESFDASSIDSFADQPRDWDYGRGDYDRAARNLGGGKGLGVSSKKFDDLVKSHGDGALEPLLSPQGPSAHDLEGRREAVRGRLSEGATVSDILPTRSSSPSRDRDPRVTATEAERTAARRSVDNSNSKDHDGQGI